MDRLSKPNNWKLLLVSKALRYVTRHPWLLVTHDPHGKDCSYNPVAFPPSMEVRCEECGKCKEQISVCSFMSIQSPD